MKRDLTNIGRRNDPHFQTLLEANNLKKPFNKNIENKHFLCYWDEIKIRFTVNFRFNDDIFYIKW